MMKQEEPLYTDGLWKYFKEISDIPRESGNEGGVREYLLSFAAKHDYTALTDAAGNVIMKVPATPGREHIAPLAFQGHMDMVCVKEEGSDHNFLTDGITLLREGDVLRAQGTTLGADNGIALALMLDLFSDSRAVHGPLEGIFTVEEETGLTGAFAVEPEMIQSRRLINLDSEEEGIFYIGCAGGNEVDGDLTISQTEISPDSNQWEITIRGLLGGHSGGEIHTQRGNAIKIMARLLSSLRGDDSFRIIRIDGGVRRNVIPSTCTAHIATSLDGDSLKKKLDSVSSIIQQELKYVESSIVCSVDESAVKATTSLSQEQSTGLIRSLLLAPHGVLRMSEALENVVETSANLAIISTEEGHVHMVSSHRSSVESARDHAAELTEEAFSVCGAEVVRGGSYPAWTPDPESPLARFCAEAYRSSDKKEPVITAIHAGLECGIINDRIKGMDSVSLGPDIEGVHSVNERLSISSSERVASFIRHLCSIVE